MAFLKHKVFVSSLTFPGQHFNGSFEIWNFIKFSSQASIETVRTLSAKKRKRSARRAAMCIKRERDISCIPYPLTYLFSFFYLNS